MYMVPYVVILGRPYIRALPKISAVAGHDLTISCPAAGYPISSIKWERGEGCYLFFV